MSRSSLSKLPCITIALIAANILFFLFLELMGGSEDAVVALTYGALYPPLVTEWHEYWRLLTATFIHFGAQHLFDNMLLLGAAGRILEHALGHIRFLLLYLLAGLGGTALSCFVMLHSGDYAVSGGASGAVFGVLGALLWIVLLHRGHYEELTGRGMIFMILLALYFGYSTAGVDNWGHIGGLIAGFLLGILLYRKKSRAL